MKRIMSDKCLYCYQPLEKSENDFHTKCSRKIFGTANAPVLDYSLDQMHELAKKVVQSHVTVPGVQAKLSFHFEPASWLTLPKGLTVLEERSCPWKICAS
jgi:serine/threonine-protein kinase HipA